VRATLPAGALFGDGVYDEATQTFFDGLRQALGALLRRLLVQNSEDVAAWRDRLQEALGSQAGAIRDLVPGLERLLGPQSVPAELAPAEQRERLHAALGTFTTALTAGGAPLVLFLDNLQWADRPTLDLLPHLVRPREGQPLFILAAARSEDTGLNPPLEDALALIAGAGVECTAWRSRSPRCRSRNDRKVASDRPDRTQALRRGYTGRPAAILHIGELLSR
jgi:hypothetical protein